jgi:hypothetical protein
MVLAGVLAVAVRNHFNPASKPLVISGTVFVTSAGRTLELRAGDRCVHDQFTAAETPTRVTLWLMISSNQSCVEPSLNWWTDTVRLRAPLGRRALIDGLTGTPVSSFDERQFARVTYLPPGTSGVPSTLYWQRAYTTADRGGIWVTQEPGNQTATLLDTGGGGFQERSVTIQGKPGTLDYTPYSPGASAFTFEQVVWQEGGFTFQVRAQANHRTVTVNQLLRIANGLVLSAP